MPVFHGRIRRTMTFALSMAPWVIAVLFAEPAHAGDRKAAEASCAEGERGLREKAWTEAEAAYRKALVEEPGFPPARVGLAETLAASGRLAEAGLELQSLAADLKAAPSPEWKELAETAEKRLASLRSILTPLRKIVDVYAKEVAALAKKGQSRDAWASVQGLSQVLTMAPDHKEASSLLGKLQKASPARTVVVFNGLDLGNWTYVVAPQWQCREGVILAEASESASFLMSTDYFRGDFDLRAEFRLDESKAEPPHLALCAARDAWNRFNLGIYAGHLVFSETVQNKTQDPIGSAARDSFKRPVDFAQWNSFEIRVREKEVVAVFNGEEFARQALTGPRLEGYAGIVMQNCKGRIRIVEGVLR